MGVVHQLNFDVDQEQPTKRITFDECYAKFPKKKARKDAMKAWAEVSLDDRKKILPAIMVQRQSEDWRKDGGKFIPHFGSWLRGERWDDELDSDLTLGTCSWNMHGNRGPEPRCQEPATTEKRGTPYCRTHSERIS